MFKPLKGSAKLAQSNAIVFNNLTGLSGDNSEDKLDTPLLTMFRVK
jgi:hypothetical protein